MRREAARGTRSESGASTAERSEQEERRAVQRGRQGTLLYKGDNNRSIRAWGSGQGKTGMSIKERPGDKKDLSTNRNGSVCHLYYH